ncbi:MAG TPA: hypothetical protein VIX73_23165 [Kofleriaceae bacterium]
MRDVSLAAIIPRGDLAGRIAPEGMPVTDVGIITLPAGAIGGIFLHLGQKGDPIPLNLQGQNFHLADPEDTGIWVSVPVALGAITVQFLIGLKSTVESRI